MRYKLIIFDFDGTLADSFPYFVSVFNTLADEYKFKRIDTEQIHRYRGFDARQMMRHVQMPTWKLPFVARRFRKLMRQDIEQIRLFDGVSELLHELIQQGVTLAVVTANSFVNARRVLGNDNADLIDYFECGASLFGKHAKIRKILKRSGIPPADAIYIGDQISDLQAAHREKVAFGAVAWGYATLDSLRAHAPREIFLRLEDIHRIGRANS